MADRTSANIFGRIFEILAEHPHETKTEISFRVWKLLREQNLDFSPGDMHCHQALLALSFAFCSNCCGYYAPAMRPDCCDDPVESCTVDQLPETD